MDEYILFLLDRIQEYRNDSLENPEETENNNMVVGVLVKALAVYETLKA